MALIEPGTVIRCFVTDINPPKIKFFIILGIADDYCAVGTIYINTKINKNIYDTIETIDLQIPVSPKECPFLNHNSYIDCAKLFVKDFPTLKNKDYKGNHMEAI